MRLFFGIPVSDAGRQMVSSRIDSLRQSRAFGKVTWVKPEAVHITLRFLGELPDSILPALNAWPAAFPNFSPVTCSIGALGGFPNLTRPKVLFLDVTPHEPFLDIYRHLDAFLLTLGIPQEDRPYNPHLTLGRVKVFSPSPSPFRPFPTLSDTLRQIVLFQSHLTSAGPIYTPVSTLSA